MKKRWADPKDEQSRKEGNILRNIRISADMTMRELAVHLGISHPAISQVEHGKLNLPRYRQEQWVTLCGCTVHEYDKLLGKKLQIINHKAELISMLKNLDQETIELAYNVIKRFSENIDLKEKSNTLTKGEDLLGKDFAINAI